MAQTNVFRYFLIGWLTALSFPSIAGIPEGVQYLASQSRTDGRIASDTSIATPYQSTAEALSALIALNETAQPALFPGLQFLQQDFESFQSTERLSRLILAKAQQGQIDTVLIGQLQNYQNSDGGFGELPGYGSTALDTAFALQALEVTGRSTTQSALQALNYLLNVQNGNGGWSVSGNASQSYVTALCLEALSPYALSYQGVPAAISLGETFLFSQQAVDGLWQEDFQSAVVLHALMAFGKDKSGLEQSVNTLSARQSSDGSWQNDVYTTALVLRALYRYQAVSGGVETTGSGSAIGTVVLSGSGEPIPGATVSLASQPGLSVLSDADGNFRLTGLPAGSLTLSVSKTGYLGASSIVPVFSGQQSNAGDIALAVDAQTGLVRAGITDGLDQSLLAGVNVVLSGPQAYQGSTDANGTLEFAAVLPGSYALSLDKTGYQSLTGQVTVVAGGIVNIKQSMLKTGAYLDTNPGDVFGRIVDGLTGVPLSGAQFTLNTGATAIADNQGQFTFAALPRGAYQGQLAAEGYQGQTLSFDFAPGVVGNLGDLRLYPLGQVTAATSLTLLGQVVDGVSGQAIPGATVQFAAQTATADSQGNFVISDISQLAFNLDIAADGYQSLSFSMTASGFGEVQQSFALPPANTDSGLTTSTLSGAVIDAATGLPVEGATVQLGDASIAATSDATGHYELSGVSSLSFSVQAFALGYQSAAQQISIANHGLYALDIPLNTLAPVAGDKFQIVSLNAPAVSAGANELVLFESSIANLTDQIAEASVIGQVVNANDEIVATVSPYLPGTEIVESHYSFEGNETKALTIPWNTQQNSPGFYRLILRVVEPGTISRALPTGVVLAESETASSVKETAAFTGTMALQPPITQVGTQVPVQFDALVVNSGNVPLSNETFELTVNDPATGDIVHQATATIATIGVSEHLIVAFGDWIPTSEGDLPITVKAQSASLPGLVEGLLYVGDKASGTFTVDKTVVPEGNQSAQAKISLQGVDTAIGSTIDPLFFAVRQAVTTGGEYTAREALNWQKRNRCLGCHIQTQSLVGVAAAYQKNLGDKLSANTMYNTVASSQQEDGSLRDNQPQFTRTETALGLWSLTQWGVLKESFRTMYRAAKHMYDRRSQSGIQTWWTPDHRSGWWYSNESHTAMAVKGYAHLLQTAGTIDLFTVSDYSLHTFAALGGSGTNNNPLDFEAGPDGLIYNVKRNGQIVSIDPVSGAVQLIGSSGHNSFGLAIAEDGTQFIVGDSGRLTRRNPDGTLNTLLSGGGTFTDVEFGPDGYLYIVDYTNHRLLRMSDPDSGQLQVVAQGGLLSNPYGLAFDPEGNAIIANYSGWNIIKVTPAGVTSVYAEGLQYRPIWITSDQQGGFYYSSSEYSATPSGINYLRSTGVIERLRGGNVLRGTVYLDGQVYVAGYYDNQLYEVVESPLNTALLTNYANEVTRATNYFLARYQDNTSDNIIQAMRLTGLAEAKTVVTDAALLAQIESAIGTIEQVLRNRQRSDGGWGRYVGWGSDAMVTALVGLALDYTNPSADDPMVRSTIQYLLNNQLSDHSWRSNNGILSTRLAATSLVVAYLPVALERLGGIDVDLHLTMPGNINLGQPSITPTEQTTGGIDQTLYLWRLVGVTANGREISFNLDLLDMVLGEQRAAADEAYIQFKNSFTDELIRVDLPIPTIRAASELVLQVGTDKATYVANEPVAIDLTVDNSGPTAAEGHIELMIRAIDSADALANLNPVTVPSVQAGGQLLLNSNWMTGTTLAGNYEVYARLFDTQNRLLDEQTAPFQIVHGDSPVIDGRVVTDKLVYQAWDQVLIDGRIQNISANVIQPPTHYVLTVTDPLGQVVFTQDGPVNELPAGALQDRQFELALADAIAGSYAVTWLIQDQFSRDLLATRTASFTVERHALQGITGLVQANPAQVYQGDPTQCLEQVTNLASAGITGLTLTSQVVSAATSQVMQEITRVLDMVGGQTLNEQRSIATDSLAIGEYACLLTANIDGQTQQIGAALFAVLEPPIKIEGHLGTGDRGRILVLIDDAPKRCDGFDRVGVEAALPVPLAAGASVTAMLYDAGGNLLDQETGLTDDRLIDQQPGSGGVNLILDDIAPNHIAVSVAADSALGAGYRVQVTADDGNAVTTFDSGPIATDCSEPLLIGSVYGDMTLTDVSKLPAANDPLGPNHIPDLATQRTRLETVLTEAGWSYTIATNADDFTRELRSGGYVAYLLLSEQVKLDEAVQKELREAVVRGEGLIEAGGHDQRQGRIDQALSIKFQGKHPSMQGIRLTQNDWTAAGEAIFQLVDRTLKAVLDGAALTGVFIDDAGSVTTEPAVTVQTYGQGRTLYMGFDLAAELALAARSSPFESLLLDALDAVHPALLSTTENGVYPLRVTLDNLGIATPGRVLLTLPPGVGVIDAGEAAYDGSTLTWPFDLAEGETRLFDTWLQLPADAFTLTALVQSGLEPDWIDQATFTLNIVPEALATVDSVQAQAALLTGNDYKQVNKYLDWALADSQAGRWSDALAALLRAADALIPIGTPDSEALRLDVAKAIRSVAQQVN